MKRIVILFLLIGLFGCEKEVIPLPNKPNVVVNAFTSKAPVYTLPNISVGQIKNEHYFLGYNIIKDSSAVKYDILGDFSANGVNWKDSYYRYWDKSRVFFDYNNDGKIDMFAFLTNFKTQPFGSDYGKNVLVGDVSVSNVKTYTESVSKLYCTYEVNDFNNDGISDLIEWNGDGHGLTNGGVGSKSSVKILYFDKSGNYVTKNVGEPMGCNGVSGDIDNDGDIDIINWGSPTNDASKPYLYLNDGSGNFTLKNSSDVFNGIDYILNNSARFVVLGIALFDLNKDGYLDIVVGENLNKVQTDKWASYELPNCRIYWGNKNGTFDFINNFSDLPNTSIFKNTALGIEGFSFLDYDKDGDYDVFVSIQSPNQSNTNCIIQCYQNLGNGKFKDVTNDVIDKSDVATFPNFSNIRMYDFDGDGDYDLFPDNVASWDNMKYNPKMFWENINGKFYIKNN